jgi:release factor glutamine methyltransferase
MIVSNWLQNAIKKLESASVPTARLDSEILLADYLDKDRTWIHAHPDFDLPAHSARSDPAKQGPTLQNLNEMVERRMSHVPLAYIRGKQEFYGRDFKVSPDTLTPRPETETMIDLFLKIFVEKKIKFKDKIQILDIGTGSGCIIISLSLELAQLSNINHQISFSGLDISEEALNIAKMNTKELKAKVKFKKFDLLSNTLPRSAITNHQIILANLPYVPNDFHINLAATHEPGFAIFGGKDGLDYYRMLFKKIPKNTKLILTESLPPQHQDLINIAKATGFKLLDSQDLIHVFSR